jgi:hypothetical protein
MCYLNIEYLTRDLIRNIRTRQFQGAQTFGLSDIELTRILSVSQPPESIYVPGVLSVLFLAFNKVAEAGEEQAC